MAEIKIRRKRVLWPWILGIILLAAVIVYILYANDNILKESEAPGIMNNGRIDNETGFYIPQSSNTDNHGLTLT